MNLFNRLKKGAAAQSVQTARTLVTCWDGIQPLYTRDCMVYDELRHSIPIIDAAIDKIVRLVGHCFPICKNQAAQLELEQFFRNVQVGAMAFGMDNFIRTYLDGLLTYGTAVGEIVLSADGSSIAGLYHTPLRNVEFRNQGSPFSTQICAVKNGVSAEPIPYPELIVCSALNPKPGELRGVSLLHSLPFVTDVLTKIYASIGQNFERIANLRYAVTYKPGTGTLDRAYAKEIADNIATEWADAMNAAKSGNIKDFVAVGDVDIKVIGADNQMINSEIPVRQMLEQIVAKLGIPPFLLGLSWSTSERMSVQQTDILTSELESYRRIITPAILRICTIFLRLNGYGCDTGIEWDNINLQDEAELANARLTNLEADRLEAELKKPKEAQS